MANLAAMVARCAILLIVPFAFAACAGAPPSRPAPHAPERAAEQAVKLVGKPYRYGGASPSSGFDCSGLVQFSYRQAGAAVPRSNAEQRSASVPVSTSSLRRGDLVFFDQEGKKNSHVGIYIGGGEFVHAPSSSKHVRRDRIDAPYWKKHLSETRRLRAATA